MRKWRNGQQAMLGGGQVLQETGEQFAAAGDLVTVVSVDGILRRGVTVELADGSQLCTASNDITPA